MDDLSQKLGDILSDPSMMEQIKSLGSMLGLGSDSTQQPVPPPPAAPAPVLQTAPNPLGGLSPDMIGMIMKFAPLLSSMNQENDSTRLLNSLRPFLSENRQGRIDSSIRLLSLMRMLPMIKEMFGKQL